MGKERFLKELGLSPEMAEPDKAKSEVIRGNSESEDKKSSPPAEEKGDVREAALEAPQLIEESADYPAEQPPDMEPATQSGKQHAESEEEQAAPAQIEKIEAEELAKPKPEAMEGDTDREGDLRESAADEAAPDSGQFLGSKAADELEPGRSTLAAAAILPLRLLGTKKAWMWLAVLVGIAIAGYFLWRWYSKRKKVTLPTNEQPKMHSGDPVRDFMDDYR